MNRVSNSTHQSPSIALHESLAESRISVLYQAHRAKETNDMVLANELPEKGQSLKIELARIRRTLTANWTQQAAALLKRSKTAQSELSRLAAKAEISARKTKAFSRDLGTVSNILALARKVL